MASGEGLDKDAPPPMLMLASIPATAADHIIGEGGVAARLLSREGVSEVLPCRSTLPCQATKQSPETNGHVPPSDDTTEPSPEST